MCVRTMVLILKDGLPALLNLAHGLLNIMETYFFIRLVCMAPMSRIFLLISLWMFFIF